MGKKLLFFLACFLMTASMAFAQKQATGTVFDSETLYWAGYLYRYWHFYTGESSKEIYRQADAETINTMYYGYHTLDIKMAIDLLKENSKKL